MRVEPSKGFEMKHRRLNFMTDYSEIKQDIDDANETLQQLVSDIRDLDAKKAQLLPELNAQQGVIRFLVNKIPVEDRESVLTPPSIEESADSDS